MEQKPVIINVKELFHNVKYEIPIYQRNYAWEEEHIQQLIDDIRASTGTYFLGNLIVNQKDTNKFEVIDGQQRLTTLYLLQKYLDIGVSEEALYFEAREKSNRTLDVVGTKEVHRMVERLRSEELLDGYKIIERYFTTERIDRIRFGEKLEDVQLVRIQVPRDIDLNHYFEVMNTRGEQLELHEIAKAKLLSKLSTDKDKEVASRIWEACSKMDSYIQMNVNKQIRDRLFSNDWSELRSNITRFDDVKKKVIIDDENLSSNRTKTLLQIITGKKPVKYTEEWKDENSDRFRSVISFPNFLLQVNEALAKSNQDESLDDKNFLRNLERNWENEEQAKRYLFYLLKCRVLFDTYILKRERRGDTTEEREWSLQRLVASLTGNSWSPSYVGTYQDTIYNQKVRTLQSCLRITYTSPKTMHWISLVLRSLLDNPEADLLAILEEYAEEKVKESNYMEASGFEFERIVFTYLDYLLYRDGYSYKGKQMIPKLQDDWEFQFRNSIEHFYPQNPIELIVDEKWNVKEANSFGNLALITVSGNSKFSNAPPKTKVDYHSVIRQSLKLQIMKEMIKSNQGEWDKQIAKEHESEMFKVLQGQRNCPN